MAAKKIIPAPVKESSELSLIRKLAEILNDTGLTEIEIDHKKDPQTKQKNEKRV